MTCIVGLISEGTITMGADAATTYGSHLIRTSAESKMFVSDGFIMGFCGSPRVRQLMEHAFTAPERLGSYSVEKYIVTSWAEAARTALRTNGALQKQNEIESLLDGSRFLVGHEGMLFEISNNLSACRFSPSYLATGSGWEVAMGSLFSTEGSQRTAEGRVLKALEAAEEFIATVRGPFDVKTLEAKT